MTAQPSLRAISRIEFSIAQICLFVALAAHMAVVVVGGLIAGSRQWDGPAALALVSLAIVAAGARMVGDHFVEAANDIRRRLDLEDGLGRPVDPFIAADLIDDAPGLVRRRALIDPETPYFASSATPSPRRLVENVRESSWFTKRLAGDLARFAGALTLTFLMVGVLILIAAFEGMLESGVARSWAPWVEAAVMFLVAQGPLQAWRGYSSLRDGAGKVQDRAAELLGGTPSEADAVEIAADYHLVRRTAPVIPTIWYQRRRSELNRRWDSAVRQAA